jgi:DNA (cytosine-5)-methyltransferase 1
MTDLFCGAGGSSTGAVAAGIDVRIAANHWKLAVASHNENHPGTAHDCADISQVNPRRYPRTDILWASPECTNHSQAKGIKHTLDSTPDMFGLTLPDEAADRSRATMWDVVRFAEHHRYRAIVVENVVDAARWVLWDAWRNALTSLGYRHRVVYLNSMHAQAGGLPAPQSRDRLYVVAWRTGQAAPDLDGWLRPRALCRTCGPVLAIQSFKTARPWGRYRAQYVYRCPNSTCRHQIVEPAWLPASSAIDWTLPGHRIGDRDKPLAPRTMDRIRAGLARYSATQLVPAGGTWNDTTTEVTDVMRARTTRENEALLVPVEGRDGKDAAPAGDPLRTLTTRSETGVLTAPFEATGNDGDPKLGTDGVSAAAAGMKDVRQVSLVVPLRNHNTAKTTSEVFDTFAAAGNHHALVMPNNTGGAETLTPTSEVLRTLTTTGHQSLLRWGELLIDYNGPARPVTDPMPTQSTVEGNAITGIAIDPMDCLFRMLEPREIANGMAFPTNYIILGNRRAQVRQAGNAVTPPAARDLLTAVAQSLQETP